MGLFGNIFKPLQGKLTAKQEENMKKVAEVFKEKTGKDYQTAVVWKMTTKIMTCIIWTPIATMWSSIKNRW